MRGAGIGHVTAHLWPLRLPGQTGKAATISSLSFLFSSFLFYFIYYFFWNENRKRISASTTRFELICIRLRLHTEQADGPVNDSTRWNGRFRIFKVSSLELHLIRFSFDLIRFCQWNYKIPIWIIRFGGLILIEFYVIIYHSIALSTLYKTSFQSESIGWSVKMQIKVKGQPIGLQFKKLP